MFENHKIVYTVTRDNEKLTLEVPEDAGLYDQVRYMRIMMRFLTWCEEQIDEVMCNEEGEFKRSGEE